MAKRPNGKDRRQKLNPAQALDMAQDLIYDAWEAPTLEQAMDLAKEALDISPDCADAYVILAESEQYLHKALALYQKGVEAGERALGPKTFKEDVGDFWGLLETRPYMRARSGLAQCLWQSGEREAAIGHYQDMLRLNPNDNQGMRFILMTSLIELDRDEDAEELYRDYNDDDMAYWSYSRALLDFKKHGDSETARRALASAVSSNEFVPMYLLGHRKMPRELPGYYGMGDKDEAVLYAHTNKQAWENSEGAMKWLGAFKKRPC